VKDIILLLIPINCIIIIIIHIIIIIGISFMQGIYTYIPETTHVAREHRVTAILVIIIIILGLWRWYAT
jgi:hypothetical protein